MIWKKTPKLIWHESISNNTQKQFKYHGNNLLLHKFCSLDYTFFSYAWWLQSSCCEALQTASLNKAEVRISSIQFDQNINEIIKFKFWILLHICSIYFETFNPYGSISLVTRIFLFYSIFSSRGRQVPCWKLWFSPSKIAVS